MVVAFTERLERQCQNQAEMVCLRWYRLYVRDGIVRTLSSWVESAPWQFLLSARRRPKTTSGMS